MRMRMVEHNDERCSEIIDGLDSDCGEYDKILDILDFPLESVEGDDKDWDASNNQDLGPIPLDDFMGFHQHHIHNEYVNKAPTPNHSALINIESEQKEQVDCVDTVHRNGALRITPAKNVFQTRSPISVLESSGTCSSGKSLPIRFEMVIPVRARSKRGRTSNVNPWFLKTPIACAVGNKSSNNTEGNKRPRMSELNHTENKATSIQRFVGTKKCSHCHSTQTPQWREGPLGKNTLCNACGVRYRSGRLFPEYRPAASPTFTPSVHSNSHRKVIEIRKKAIQEETVLVENPMSCLAEFVPMSSYLLEDSMLKKG